MLTNGQKYQPPAELNDFVTPQQATAKAQKYATKLVDQALSNHEAGQNIQAAKNLVELVLMIVTPISGT
jgi:geranylgeranyl pyrophosphate synthase